MHYHMMDIRSMQGRPSQFFCVLYTQGKFLMHARHSNTQMFEIIAGKIQAFPRLSAKSNVQDVAQAQVVGRRVGVNETNVEGSI